MALQDEFEAAVDELRRGAETMDAKVDQLVNEDSDGRLEADDETLADLAACASIITRTLTLFLTHVPEDATAPPQRPQAPAPAPKPAPDALAPIKPAQPA